MPLASCKSATLRRRCASERSLTSMPAAVPKLAGGGLPSSGQRRPSCGLLLGLPERKGCFSVATYSTVN
eukprot:12579417-Alexandrium_andersonii.AAC.1